MISRPKGIVVKRHYDELTSHYRFQTDEQLFKVEVFYNVIDRILVQINERFIGMQTVNKYFSFLEPNNILNMTGRNFK